MAGGDHRREQDASDNVAVTSDGGATWKISAIKRLRAFRSAVAYLPAPERPPSVYFLA